MDQDFKARADRERERYDEGLDNRYRRYLLRSMAQFEAWRCARARQIFGRYAAPRTLELGAYEWEKWIERNGLTIPDLTCVNISSAELEVGRRRAEGARNRPDFRLMDAQALEFEESSFDVVFGAAILHHLDLDRALAEIARVLRPGGVMFFHEPMDMNPVGRLVRALTPKSRTEDERPFRTADLDAIRRRFDVRFQFTEFLTVPIGALASAAGASGDGAVMRTTFHVDQTIARIPGLRLWSRHVFLEGAPRSF